VRLPADACPHCGYRVDAASSPEDETWEPTRGDASLCIRCGALNIFTADLRLRKPTRRERREIEALPRWRLMVAAWKCMRH
jgi:DNA-directed RNA polymerase subunit RPC12/RpoP